MRHTPTWMVGLVLAPLVAGLAARGGALSASGAVAAAILGAVAMAAGWSWGLILIAYFVTAALLSRFRAGDKQRATDGRVEKGGRRDALQVLANGAAFGAAALGFWLAPAPAWTAAGAAALAASAADTWATEIGTLSKSTPVSIVGFRSVPPGTSGGITALGVLAALLGAGFVAALAFAAGWGGTAAIAALAGGVLGSTLDSVVGATVQARRWCDQCAVATEQRVHRCGSPTRRTGGWRWLDNDGVNAVATGVGGLFGAGLAGYL